MSTEAERALQEHERLRAEVTSLRATISQYDLLLALPAPKPIMEELERLRAEVAEHRAARGIEAPAPWRPSEEALWERPCGPVDEEYHDCPDGWLVVGHYWEQRFHWAWYTGGGRARAEGSETTCLGALAAAEAALAGGGT